MPFIFLPLVFTSHLEWLMGLQAQGARFLEEWVELLSLSSLNLVSFCFLGSGSKLLFTCLDCVQCGLLTNRR